MDAICKLKIQVNFLFLFCSERTALAALLIAKIVLTLQDFDISNEKPSDGFCSFV